MLRAHFFLHFSVKCITIVKLNTSFMWCFLYICQQMVVWYILITKLCTSVNMGNVNTRILHVKLKINNKNIVLVKCFTLLCSNMLRIFVSYYFLEMSTCVCTLTTTLLPFPLCNNMQWSLLREPMNSDSTIYSRVIHASYHQSTISTGNMI